MTTIQAIDKNKHNNLKVSANPTLLQSEGRHFAPLVVQEFVAASQDYPVVFVKDSDTGQFKAIALLGLKPGENEFYSPQGWRGNYTPEALTLYPFLISQNKDDDSAILCFDSASPLINETQGQALFEQEAETPWLQEQGERVVQYVEKSQMTDQFIKMLLDFELVSPQSLSLTLEDNEEYTLNGLYAIDENKLNQLDDDKFNQLRKTGALTPIYASLISMQRIHNIVRLKLATK
ncbi:SapC family protein [Psychrobium sp. 1_MG-2023]|uniref:SapC family protein n=1 Tax=Psychrobium sp. 1_MG-2023 TaxID=3062624 RepID=UPI002689F9E8|nr:SapC family protein [Psychrobium sp. 1_MG-2023]MDP2559884.1 SapC family protein [Psychrobium sp. 1_MG-2023]